MPADIAQVFKTELIKHVLYKITVLFSDNSECQKINQLFSIFTK